MKNKVAYCARDCAHSKGYRCLKYKSLRIAVEQRNLSPSLSEGEGEIKEAMYLKLKACEV
jgi:hypothetical protein